MELFILTYRFDVNEKLLNYACFRLLKYFSEKSNFNERYAIGVLK